MRFNTKPELTVTPHATNWMFMFVGLAIVGLSTNWNPVALLGSFVASIHVSFRFKQNEDTEE
jgi:hypothetical protein